MSFNQVLLSSDFLLQEHYRILDPHTQGLGDDNYHMAFTLGG
jgi:hypothetical protein